MIDSRCRICGVLTLAICLATTAAAQQPKDSHEDLPVTRARKTVRMLDDLYKNAVVLITKTYVKDESSVPAAKAAIALWGAMEKNGWHSARLVDATGEPYNAENLPKTEFEKKAIKLLTAKRPYIDRVVKKDNKRFLEVVTQVPVVMEKCTLCHPHYEDVPAGATIGAISYRIAIDE